MRILFAKIKLTKEKKMTKYVIKDNELFLEGAFIQGGHKILASGNGFVVIDDGADRLRLLIKKNENEFYDLGEPFLDVQLEALKAICKGKWKISAIVEERIIICIAKDPALLDVIPNFFYMNIPNFAEKLQCEWKNQVYSAYANCKLSEIDKLLVQVEEESKKVADYIEKQEKGMALLEKLTKTENPENEETDDKEAADYDAIIDHHPTI